MAAGPRAGLSSSAGAVGVSEGSASGGAMATSGGARRTDGTGGFGQWIRMSMGTLLGRSAGVEATPTEIRLREDGLSQLFAEAKGRARESITKVIIEDEDVLKTFMANFDKFPNVAELDLHNLDISDESVATINDLLPSLPEKLAILHLGLVVGEDVAIQFPETIPHVTKVTISGIYPGASLELTGSWPELEELNVDRLGLENLTISASMPKLLTYKPPALFFTLPQAVRERVY